MRARTVRGSHALLALAPKLHANCFERAMLRAELIARAERHSRCVLVR